MDAIVAEKLTKSFDNTKNAVDALNLAVPQGQAYALLGPHGAGKTTVIKLLSGLMTPTSGRSTVMGVDPVRRPARLHRRCGVVTSTAKLYDCMTGQENLLFFGKAAGLNAASAQSRASELMKDLGVWQARDLPVSELPTGMQQRLSLARALLLHPSVLLLDDPTFGMDAEGAQAVLGLITGLVQDSGVTVLLATTRLASAQRLCSHFTVLQAGSVLTEGSLAQLCALAGCRTRAGFRLSLEDSLPGYTLSSDHFWEREIVDEGEMPALLRKVVEDGHDIYEVRLCRPTLAEAYTTLLKKGESV